MTVMLLIMALVGVLTPVTGLVFCLAAIRNGESGWQRRHTIMCFANIILPLSSSLIAIRVMTGSFSHFF